MPRTSTKNRVVNSLGEAISQLIILRIYLISSRRRIAFQQQEEEDEQQQQPAEDGNLAYYYDELLTDMYVSHSLRLYAFVLSKRYVQPRNCRKRPVNKFNIDLHMNTAITVDEDGNEIPAPWLSPTEFVSSYRMTREAFYRLLDLIKHDKVFGKNNKRGPQQLQPAHQLLATLHYFSSFGSTAGGSKMRKHFFIAYGAKDNYVDRCVRAIRRNLRARYLTWPDVEERQKLAQHFHQTYNIPNAIMVVDGTTFQLLSRPRRTDFSDYSGRKDGYTITNLFFSDYRRRIRYYVTGWPGCAHDNRMWKNCAIYKNPEQYFSPTEYLLGEC